MDKDARQPSPSSSFEVYPVASHSASSGYSNIPIRAPLTVDSDSEYSESYSDQVHSDYSGLESEEFLSGEDDSGSFNEVSRTFVRHPHDETLEESPDEEIVVESSHVEEMEISGPSMNSPDDDTVDTVGGFVVSRPSVKNSDEETVEESGSEDGESVTCIDCRVPLQPKLGVPIAKLSLDGDYFSSCSEVEDDEFLGRARIPVPNINELALNGLEDDELTFESLVPSAGKNGPLGSDEERCTSGRNSISMESDECKPLGSNEVENVELLIRSEDCMMLKSSNLDKEEKLNLENEISGGRQNGVFGSNDEKSPAEKDFIQDSDPAVFVENTDINFDGVANSFVYSGLERDTSHFVEEIQTFEDAGAENQSNKMNAVEIEGRACNSNNQYPSLNSISQTVEPNLQMEVAVSEENESNDFEDVRVYGLNSKNNDININEGVFLGVGSFDSIDDEDKLACIVEKPTESEEKFPLLCENAEQSPSEGASEEDLKKMKKIRELRAKFLRLVQGLGLSCKDLAVLDVLDKIDLALGKPSNHDFAKRVAIDAEVEGSKELYFSSTILVVGKPGVGKSATINSIFGENKAMTSAYEYATTSVKEIVGKINGVEVRFIDTPGFRSSLSDRSFNLKILSSVKRLNKKHGIDMVLYVDRLDTRRSARNDLPLLRLITDACGRAMWRNTHIALTHATSIPLDSPSESTSLSYEAYACRQSIAVQQLISSATGHMQEMTPVSLVENNPYCKEDGNGNPWLPRGESWKQKLLLSVFSTKILSEVNSLSNIRPEPRTVSSLLQSLSGPKVCSEQSDRFAPEIEFWGLPDSDQEGKTEYYPLSEFMPSSKLQITQLIEGKKYAYFEEDSQMENFKRLREMEYEEENRREGYGNRVAVGKHYANKFCFETHVGEILCACDFRCRVSVGTRSRVALLAGLDDKPDARISVSVNGSDQLQMALSGLLLIAKTLHLKVFPQFRYR